MQRSLVTVGFFLLQLCGVLLPAAAQYSFQAGTAVTDISPRSLPALQNGGFLQRVTNQVLDRLHARSLVVSDGRETIAIVIVDSCMFPTSLCDEIKRRAAIETGLPQSRILISATHTHAAPAAMTCLGCPADESYLELVPALVAQSIADAHKNLQPAKAGWTAVDGSDLTNCRRWITRSDQMLVDPFGGRTVRAMMHPGYQNSNYTSPAGPIDPWLSVLSIVSAQDDSPICVLANLSMHYFGGAGFSADYFGEVARLLEVRIESLSGKATSGFVGMMSQGTSGDLHWMDYSKPRQGISRQQYSEAVATRVLDAWESIKHVGNLPIAMVEKRITIGRRLPSKERLEWARPINLARGSLVARNRVEVYAEQADWIRNNPKEEVVLQAVRIGDLGITAIPNEVYGITGLKLKRQSPFKLTFNLELANGAVGYIPPPEQHQFGGYTTWPARTAGLVEQAEPLIVETLLDLLESVAGKKRKSLVDSDSEYSRVVTALKPAAYWRLNDMVATAAKDTAGNNDARFEGAVALFLPETTESKTPEADFAAPGTYGSRCVYLGGGHIAASLLAQIEKPYSIGLSFWNALPSDIRDTTGVLFSNSTETLLISGRSAGGDSGKLILKAGEISATGKRTVAVQQWQHVVIVRGENRVAIYLDGQAEPDIELETGTDTEARRSSDVDPTQWRIGSDGNTTHNFDGKVDEVAVFDRALTTVEIATLYESTGFTPPRQPKPAVILGPKPTDAASRKAYADAVLASEPVAFWRLHDATSSRSARDTVGSHHARYEKNSSPLQPESTSKNFTGGRVKSAVSDLGNTYSVELWFRNELPVHSRPVTAYLFSRALDGVHGSPGDNLGIGGTHSNMGRLIVFNGNGRNQLASGQTRIPVGSWSHVVVVRENQKITLYLNGDTEPEIAAELPIDYAEDCNDVFLGGRADNFSNLEGMLEEVAVYNRALTPQEAAAHFKAARVSTR